MADRFSKLRTPTPTPRPTPSPTTDRFNHLKIISPVPSPTTDRFDALKISTTPVPQEVTDRFTPLHTPVPQEVTDRFTSLQTSLTPVPQEVTDRFVKPTPISLPDAAESPGGGRFGHLQTNTDNRDNRDNNNFKRRERRDPIMCGASTRIMPKKLMIDENTNEWEIAAARRNGIEIEEKFNMESESQFPDLATAIAVTPNIKKMKAGKRPVIPKTKPKSGGGAGSAQDADPKSKEADDDDFLTGGNKSKPKKPSFAQLAKEMAEKTEQERLNALVRKAAEEEERHKRNMGAIFIPIAVRQNTYNSLVDEFNDDHEQDIDDMPYNEEEENGYY